MFSMKARTRLPYFPQCSTEFRGRDAPPCITYSPDVVKIKYTDPQFSVGKSPRFQLHQQEVDLKSKLPLNYTDNLIYQD